MAMQDPARFYGRYQEQNPMDYADLLGGRSLGSMMGGDAESQAMIEDLLMGRGDQYSPEGLQAPPMFPGEGDPIQDFIRQQLAGDVVPMVRPGPYRPPAQSIHSPGAQGMQSIQSMGGQHGPNLDLMSIYNILTGREVGR